MQMTKLVAYISKPNQALAVPRTVGMMRLFPEGKPLENLWVIKHGLAEYTLLKRLGFRLPNPIIIYYDWASGKPFSIQRITASLITSEPRAYVLNDMGTGKTRTTLWSWDYLYSNGYAGKLLVLAKLSTLTRVWAHECFASIPHRKCVVLHGPKKKRLEHLNDPEANLFILNHDGLKVLLDELNQRKDINVLVIDELATFRNMNDRSKVLLKYAEKMKFVWGLTGSPQPHSPLDVWMQCKIITPHTVPKYKTNARDQLMTKQSEFLYVPKPDAIQRAYSWMQPAVRFTLDDVVELPEIVAKDIDAPLTPQQDHIYKTLVNDMLVQIGNDQINAINSAVLMNKLLQVAGGYVYSSTCGVVKLDVTPRKEILVDLITSAGKKVLVFFPFRHMVNGVSEFLNGLKDEDHISHAVIHGDVSPKERDKIFNAFQDTDQYKAILAHPGCMAHGLTLTAADTIIWYCPIVDYELYEQANARIRRVGQKHRQQIFHLRGTPVERKLYAMLRRKERDQNLLLALFEEATEVTHGA